LIVLVMDDRVLFESESMSNYLSGMQAQAIALGIKAEGDGDPYRLVAANSVEDALGQVRDGLS
jgi:hypothetical protein